MSKKDEVVEVIEDVNKGEGGDPSTSKEPAPKTGAKEPKSTPKVMNVETEVEVHTEPEVPEEPTPEELYQADVTGGKFDETKSTITIKPASIVADGKSAVEVTVTLYSESDSTRLLEGVEGVELTFNETALTPIPFSKETKGKYAFVGKASNKVGVNTIGFKTKGKTSAKTVTLTLTKPEPTPEELYQADVAGGKFDQEKSTITVTPDTMTADGKSEFKVDVTLYSESDPSRLLEKVVGVSVVSDLEITPGKETAGVYAFTGKAPSEAKDVDLKFQTTAGESTKTVKISFTEVVKQEVIGPSLLFYQKFPWRNSALFYAKFNVLLEINKIQEENDGEWNDVSLFKDSKYSREIATISHIIENYENAEVLESRGWYNILNKEQLLKGNFYKNK